MSRRTSSRLAWSLWALSIALFGAGGSLQILNGSTPTVEPREPGALGAGFLLLFLLFSTVGATVASRRPANPIGWIFVAMGLIASIGVAAGEYALYALGTREGALPAGTVAAWISALLIGAIPLTLMAFTLLLFPNGRLLSSRWRPVAWANLLAVALFLLWALKPGRIDNFALLEVTNPFGIEGGDTALEALGISGFSLTLAVFGAGLVSLVLRYRRARGDERLQLKWFAFATGLLCAVFAAAPVVWSIPSLPEALWPALFIVGVGGIPVATGIAILRYRLYEIDVIIRRTLVYGALTALLGGTYFGIVLALQQVFSPITQGSDLAIAGSTLAVAAAFRPARRRIQELVDRRFYRRKYDAARTLEAFSARLREEIDLDSLCAELTGVVRETMQPGHVSLWLR